MAITAIDQQQSKSKTAALPVQPFRGFSIRDAVSTLAVTDILFFLYISTGT